jgi:hypothetical protein
MIFGALRLPPDDSDAVSLVTTIRSNGGKAEEPAFLWRGIDAIDRRAIES